MLPLMTIVTTLEILIDLEPMCEIRCSDSIAVTTMTTICRGSDGTWLWQSICMVTIYPHCNQWLQGVCCCHGNGGFHFVFGQLEVILNNNIM